MANGLQTLASEVMRETGYNPPSTFIGNNAQDARRMVAIVNRAGRDIARTLWQRQVRDFTVSVSGTTLYALPAGFYQFISNAGWQGTEPLLGPTNTQDWQYFRQNVAGSGIHFRWRVYTELRSNGVPIKRLQVDPTTSASPVTFTMPYQTEYWAVNVSASVTYRTGWVSEDDDPIVDTELLTLCVKYRWLQAKGLDYADAYNEYHRVMGIEKARDFGGPQKLSLNGSYSIDLPNIPETGIGS